MCIRSRPHNMRRRATDLGGCGTYQKTDDSVCITSHRLSHMTFHTLIASSTYCRSFFLSFLCSTAHLTATTGLRDTQTSRNMNLSSPCSLINWAVLQVPQNGLLLCFMVITTACHYKYQFKGICCHIAGQDGWWHTRVIMTLRLGFTVVP